MLNQQQKPSKKRQLEDGSASVLNHLGMVTFSFGKYDSTTMLTKVTIKKLLEIGKDNEKLGVLDPLFKSILEPNENSFTELDKDGNINFFSKVKISKEQFNLVLQFINLGKIIDRSRENCERLFEASMILEIEGVNVFLKGTYSYSDDKNEY